MPACINSALTTVATDLRGKYDKRVLIIDQRIVQKRNWH